MKHFYSLLLGNLSPCNHQGDVPPSLPLMGPMSKKAVKKAPSLDTRCFNPIFTALGCSCCSQRSPAATCRPPAAPSPPGELVPVSQLQPYWSGCALGLEGSSPREPSSPRVSWPCRLEGKTERCQTPHLLFLFLLRRSNPKKAPVCSLPNLVSPGMSVPVSATLLLSQPDAQPWGRGGCCHQRRKSKLSTKRAASPKSDPGDRTQGLGEMTASKHREKGCPQGSRICCLLSTRGRSSALHGELILGQFLSSTCGHS